MIVREFTERFHDGGTTYRARVACAPYRDRLWQGWIEFVRGDGTVLRTDRETVQPSCDAVTYWAEGLEPLYLEGAFERAVRPGPGSERAAARASAPG